MRLESSGSAEDPTENSENWIEFFGSPALVAGKRLLVPAEGVKVPDYTTSRTLCEDPFVKERARKARHMATQHVATCYTQRVATWYDPPPCRSREIPPFDVRWARC